MYNKIMEQWKRLKQFPNYMISDMGRVYSLVSHKVLKLNNCGEYSIIFLSKDKKEHKRYIHRLVAETFVPNFLNQNIVNHKNGNKKDNKAINLEWVSQKENVQHAFRLGLIKRKKRNIKTHFYTNNKHYRIIRKLKSGATFYYFNIQQASSITGMSIAFIRQLLTTNCLPNEKWYAKK